MNRFNLLGQIFWHGRTMRFVVTVERVAKGGSASVKNTGAVFCIDIAGQSAQHRDHAVQCTGRVARLVAQVRQCMKGTVQVG